MDLPELTPDEFYEAVKEGVKEFLQELWENQSTSTDPFDAIREGTKGAIWQLATNATDMPCADFYDMVRQGVKEGCQGIRHEVD